MSLTNTKRNSSLEGLRLIFIILMILHHTNIYVAQKINIYSSIWNQIANEFVFAVSFFFILSGMGCVLGYREKLINQEVSPLEFVLKKLIKIFPTYLLFLVCSIWIYNIQYNNDMTTFLLHVFSLQSIPMQGPSPFKFNPVGWYISCLVVFYVLYSFIYSLNFRQCIALVTLCLLVLSVNAYFYTGSNLVSMFYTNPLFRSIEFLSGMCLALWLDKKHMKPSLIFQFLSVVFLFVFIAFSIKFGLILDLRLRNVLYIIPLLLLFYSFYAETSFSKKILGNKFVTKLSPIILVIYLCHHQILYFIPRILPKNIENTYFSHFFPYGFISIVIFTIIFSWLVYVYYTQPLNKILQKIFLKKKCTNFLLIKRMIIFIGLMISLMFGCLNIVHNVKDLYYTYFSPKIRIDLFFAGQSSNTLEVSSENISVHIEQPSWFKNPKWLDSSGSGTVIQLPASYDYEEYEITIKAQGNGYLWFYLKGNSDDNTLNGFAYYKDIVLNGVIENLNSHEASLEKPISFYKNLENGEVLKFSFQTKLIHNYSNILKILSIFMWGAWIYFCIYFCNRKLIKNENL